MRVDRTKVIVSGVGLCPSVPSKPIEIRGLSDMLSLQDFHHRYRTTTSNLNIRGRDFGFFVPESLEQFLDPEDMFHNFPLWSKIWEAAIILADHLAGMPVDSNKRFLEIGSGLGVAGIVASCFGHRLTMTEYNPDALNFMRANAIHNLAWSRSNPEICTLDWHRPRLDGRFDYIIGSEVIYREMDHQPLLNLFRAYLKPGGAIILAERVRKTSLAFFKQMGEFFKITAQKKTLRSTGKEIRVILCRMTHP